MSKIAIVTDSSSGITKKEAQEIGVFLIPMPFFINGQLYLEGETISNKEFYIKLREDADISTSQPAVGTIINLWDEILKDFDEIVYIPMSGGLSSSVDTAKMIALDYENKVFVVDNKRISITQRQSVLDALYLVNKGYSAKEIAEILEKESYDASIYLAVKTLKYLKKGGRITPTVAAIGTALNIMPVLKIPGGKIDVYKRVRGSKQTERVMFEAIANDIEEKFNGEKVSIQGAYSGSMEEAEIWREKIQKAFNTEDIHLSLLPLNVSCHTGEGACGIACMRKVEDIY